MTPHWRCAEVVEDYAGSSVVRLYAPNESPRRRARFPCETPKVAPAQGSPGGRGMMESIENA
jgi:hypothetical protein